MRIYELARQLGVPSNDLVAECRKRHIVVKNHMSSLGDKDARRLIEVFEALTRKQDDDKKRDAVAARKSALEQSQRDALNARTDEMRKQQEEQQRLIEEGRRKRQEEETRRLGAEAALKAKVQVEQKERAALAAQAAMAQRQKAGEVALQAQKEEMELLAKARLLRAEQEKRAADDARKRADDEARRGSVPNPAIGGPSRPLDAAAALAAKKGKVRPTQVFAVKDVVRKSKKRPGEEGAPVDPAAQPPMGAFPGRGPGGGPPRPGGPQRPGNQRGPITGPPSQKDLRQMRRDLHRHDSIAARGKRRPMVVAKKKSTDVFISGDITVRALAEKLEVTPAEIVARSFALGEMININSLVNDDLLQLLGEEFGLAIHHTPEGDDLDLEEQVLADDADDTQVSRPPVITIMGHVDHGKTTLLDTIRKAKVAEGEAGGITQHIGAYQVETSRGPLTFLDTPGHEAFTAMRARGAQVTDIVVLVVAANDGVQRQTIEAINHAKAAEVPIVVAINKIDLPGVDQMRIQNELMAHGLVSETLGGDTIFVPVSAKKGLGIDALLEALALQAELLTLTANPDRTAVGSVVESHVDPLRGAVATILVQRGTLNLGDYFVVGDEYGRVRAMRDATSKEVHAAPPSAAVEIIGLTGSPAAGEQLIVLPDEAQAREIAEKRQMRRRSRALFHKAQHTSLESLSGALKEGKAKELRIILKTDVQGSLEALRASILKEATELTPIKMPHAAVGGIVKSDVELAEATDAIIMGFNTRVDAEARTMADQKGIEIKTYQIIYQLLDDLRAALTGMLAPTFREQFMGTAEVLQVFKVSKVGNIAGCIIRDGEVTRDSKVRLFRDQKMIFQGDISSLKHLKNDVSSVKKGFECGIGLHNFPDIKQGDTIEAYKLIEEKGVLPTAASA